ncbi:MAG: ABC transporter permease [Planctomycetota bacterium]|nr:ABC transporter permease [Planctomycetota bacterium]
MKFFAMIVMALGSLSHHKLRSMLTMLGIVFGVGAVIAMLGIGEGARVEALRYIQDMGLNNVLIQSRKPPAGQAGNEDGWIQVYGITFGDQRRIASVVEEVQGTVATRDLPLRVWRGAARIEAKVVATEPAYRSVANLEVARGRFFSGVDMAEAQSVAVLGAEVARELFGYRDPIGKPVRLDGEWFRTIGVLAPKRSSSASTGMATSDFDRAIYLPETAATAQFGITMMTREAGSVERSRVEISNLIVTLAEGSDVRRAAGFIERIVARSHKNTDFSVLVPLELLEQQQRTQRIFSIVMGSIAGISLLVGGIGIMNIMLATVMERTREIGIRRAVGARRYDIIMQFLVETVVLSLCGGLIGVGTGYLGAFLVHHYAEMTTVVTLGSVGLSLGISCAVGIVFGLYPATMAARMKPIDALRTA